MMHQQRTSHKCAAVTQKCLHLLFELAISTWCQLFWIVILFHIVSPQKQEAPLPRTAQRVRRA